MSNNISDDMEFNEDLSKQDEKETIENKLCSESLYLQLGQPKVVKQVPLALTIPDNLPPMMVEGYTLAWTKLAHEKFAEIQKLTVKSLPYSSLRCYLEVELENAERIKSSVGLSRFDLNTKNTNESEAFAYLSIHENQEKLKKNLRTILNNWITKYLKPFADQEKLSPDIVERLQELREKGELLKITPITSQVLPWTWSKETGTTRHRNEYDYRVLADFIARQIAGKKLFQGLGSMKRIISSSGTFASGVAELMTDPTTLPDKKGTFSLVVRLEVVTYPSLHQPLLKVDVSKRRWLSQLKSPDFDRNAISGFVFSQNYDDRTFSYKVLSNQKKNNKQDHKQEKKKNWFWKADTDFEILQRKFSLPLKSSDGQQIALGKASTEQCQVVLTYRNGLQDNSEEDEEGLEEYGIETGVPEIDKLEAFEVIAQILNPLGIESFESYSQVKLGRNSSHKLDDTAARTINIYTLVSAILKTIKTNKLSVFTPNYLKQLTDSQLENLLRQNFNFGLKAIHQGRKSIEFERGKRLVDQTKELKALIQANEAAMRRLYPNERPSLIIFYEDELKTEMQLLQAIARILWGETLEIIPNRLPPETHGPRKMLPGKELKAKERFNRRVKAWESITQQIKKRTQRTFCLILARKFYPDPSGQKTASRDDKVNKPSSRRALAGEAGACVQFLGPITKSQKTNGLMLANFFHRAQTSLKDLLSAHSGRIDDLQQKVDKYLKDIPPQARPKEILAFTIVRKQRGRARGRIDNTFLLVAMRLKVDTGKCELCCAYEKGNTLAISPWSSFPDAIAFIAQLSPIKLADKNEVRKIRFMEFVKQIVSNSVEEGTQPLVIIDSSNCVQLWGWLADIRMNANQIDLGQQYERMQQEWQGARLIRIRQDLAPGIIDKKVRQLAETSLEDTRSIKELKELPPTLEIPSASSSTGLFRLTATNQTGCVAYLSVGNKRLHSYLRGQSCYRSSKINTSVTVKKEDHSREKVCNQAKLAVHRLSTQPPFADRWPTPNPLEIVVTLRQPEDDPDSLAALVESLRYSFGHYSEWTALPAPLFFERVVRDYISEFAIEDENIEVEPDL